MILVYDRFMSKIGRNDPCPCGAKKPDGTPLKYKRCHLNKEVPDIPPDVIAELLSRPTEPFEKGGFLTGRPFISEQFNGERMRAMANKIYRRPLDETFHMFILRRFFDTLTQAWVEAEEKKDNPHTLIKWSRETQKIIKDAEMVVTDKLRSAKLTGNMRSLLAIAYDFYSLEHCNAPVPQKLLNRLRDENQFQGARYEIAVAGLVCRAGFEIEWQGGNDKHCEFIGKHKITGDKAAFEAKSHHRGGVLGRDGIFDSEAAQTKIMDHVREALEQVPKDSDLPLVIFDDLNLPLTANIPLDEKKWFKQVEEHLEKYGFLGNKPEYARCAILIVTNFSWHFHYDVPPDKNELITHFNIGGPYSLNPDTALQYLDLAAQQYGFVPSLEHEFKGS